MPVRYSKFPGTPRHSDPARCPGLFALASLSLFPEEDASSRSCDFPLMALVCFAQTRQGVSDFRARMQMIRFGLHEVRIGATGWNRPRCADAGSAKPCERALGIPATLVGSKNDSSLRICSSSNKCFRETDRHTHTWNNCTIYIQG